MKFRGWKTGGKHVTYRSFLVHKVGPMPLADGFPIFFVRLFFFLHFTNDMLTIDERLKTTNYDQKDVDREGMLNFYSTLLHYFGSFLNPVKIKQRARFVGNVNP